MRKRKVWLLSFLIGALFLTQTNAGAETGSVFQDTREHWARDTIQWGVNGGLLQGFPDGTFRPDEGVTQGQLLAMLFRAYPNSFEASSDGAAWYSDYYLAAADRNWPVREAQVNKQLTRGDVAVILAASQGEALSPQRAANLLLEEGLANGKAIVNGTVVFGKSDSVTRAEAVQFVRNVVTSGRTLESVPEQQASTDENSDAVLSANGIVIGDDVETLIAGLGEPARREASEYGFDWCVYNGNYRTFAMYGVQAGTVVALYTTAPNIEAAGLSDASTSTAVRSVFGTPIDSIQKGNTRFMLNISSEQDTFLKDGAYITAFYDVHEGGTLTAVQAVDAETELAMQTYYGSSSAELRRSFERITLDLVNASRVQYGLPAVRADETASATARAHSADMAENGFFRHTNLKQESPFDRMKADGIQYRTAGENIAYGQTSAIFAHEGWMNSSGHRANILGDFERLGVGVAFRDDGAPYYTQNFYTPLASR